MTEPEELNAALAGRYEILGELGSGGMATVFRARDVRHERTVAMKVLRPELASLLGPERFLSEIRTTARLSHPHILALHDSGAAGGFLYYVMPLVDGESLRDRLNREKQLPVDEAVRITLQVAEALTYAHGHQIIHRDIKPENILLQGSYALVADFGIARAVSKAGDERITATGMALGTPNYMSPEQIAGDLDIDGRSDLYALATVLFELLSGEPPFTGPTISAILAQRFTKPAPKVTIKRPNVPRSIEAALTKAMAIAPEDRFESVALFAEALVSKEVAYHDTAGRSIAVLAFANMSDDPETEYFSDGMSEEIINVLVQIPDLRVAARTSAFSFKGKNVDLRSIGDQLSVATVLEGSVRRAGNRLRITAQLINVSDGYHLWSERYDREMTDVFAIQDEIAHAIADKLTVTLGAGKSKTAPARPTDNIEAYELYLKGKAIEHRRGPGLRTAVELYEQAVALDPDFGAAHGALAHALVLTGFYGIYNTEQVGARAVAAARIGMERAPGNGPVHAASAMVALMLEYDREKAEREWNRAMELSPSDSSIRIEYAFYLLCGVHGDFNRATEYVRQSLEQDPLSALAHAFSALVHGFADRHTETVAEARKALSIDPSSFIGHYQLGLGLVRSGDWEGALKAMTPVLGPSGRHPWIMLVVGLAHEAGGRHTEALAIYHELSARAEVEFVQPSLLLLLAHGLKLKEESARLLTLAGEVRDMTIPALLLHFNENRGLSSTPAGLALLQKMGWDDEVRRLS